jgi:hypothetical protein
MTAWRVEKAVGNDKKNNDPSLIEAVGETTPSER